MKSLIFVLATFIFSSTAFASPQIYKICETEDIKIGLWHTGGAMIKAKEFNLNWYSAKNSTLNHVLFNKNMFVWSDESDFLVIDLKNNDGTIMFNGKYQLVTCKNGGFWDM